MAMLRFILCAISLTFVQAATRIIKSLEDFPNLICAPHPNELKFGFRGAQSKYYVREQLLTLDTITEEPKEGDVMLKFTNARPFSSNCQVSIETSFEGLDETHEYTGDLFEIVRREGEHEKDNFMVKYSLDRLYAEQHDLGQKFMLHIPSRCVMELKEVHRGFTGDFTHTCRGQEMNLADSSYPTEAYVYTHLDFPELTLTESVGSSLAFTLDAREENKYVIPGRTKFRLYRVSNEVQFLEDKTTLTFKKSIEDCSVTALAVKDSERVVLGPESKLLIVRNERETIELEYSLSSVNEQCEMGIWVFVNVPKQCDLTMIRIERNVETEMNLENQIQYATQTPTLTVSGLSIQHIHPEFIYTTDLNLFPLLSFEKMEKKTAVFAALEFQESVVIPSDSTVYFPSKGEYSKDQVELTFGFLGDCQDGLAVAGEGVEIQRIYRAIVVTFSMDRQQSEAQKSLTPSENCMLRLDAATRRIAGFSVTVEELQQATLNLF